MTAVEFSRFLANNSDFLRPYAVSLTNDHEEAKDLFQETMVRALANRDKYHLGTNLRAWLYTIMRNIFINQYRRSRRFVHTSAELLAETAGYERGMIASNGGWSHIRMGEISKAIDGLPQIFRQCFELHYAGYKYQEIADVLEEPLGTIKSRIHFARRQLKSQLDR